MSSAAFGYWIGSADHGRGFMLEAMPSAVAAEFLPLDVDTSEAAVQPANADRLPRL